MEQYLNAFLHVRSSLYTEESGEEAVDLLVRRGMHLDRKDVEPLLLDLLKDVDSEYAAWIVADLADYNVSLSDDLTAMVERSLRAKCEWARVGAIFCLLRSAGPDMAEEAIASWVRRDLVDSENAASALGCLSDLRERLLTTINGKLSFS